MLEIYSDWVIGGFTKKFRQGKPIFFRGVGYRFPKSPPDFWRFLGLTTPMTMVVMTYVVIRLAGIGTTWPRPSPSHPLPYGRVPIQSNTRVSDAGSRAITH